MTSVFGQNKHHFKLTGPRGIFFMQDKCERLLEHRKKGFDFFVWAALHVDRALEMFPQYNMALEMHAIVALLNKRKEAKQNHPTQKTKQNFVISPKCLKPKCRLWSKLAHSGLLTGFATDCFDR